MKNKKNFQKFLGFSEGHSNNFHPSKNKKTIGLIFLVLLILMFISLIFAEDVYSPTTPPTTPTTPPTTSKTPTPPTTTTQKEPIQIPSDQEGKIKWDGGKVSSADIRINTDSQTEVVLGGKKFYAPKGSQILVNENEKSVIQVRVPKDSKIQKDPAVNNSNDDKSIRYIAIDGPVALPDGKTFTGTLSHDGKNYFLAKGNEVTIDNVKIKNMYGSVKNVNEKVNIYFKDGKFEGNYVYFGDKIFKTGSLNSMDGHPVEFLPGNKYIEVKKDAHLAIVPFANSQFVLQNGKLAQTGGGAVQEDYSTYWINSKGELLYKKGIYLSAFNAKELEGKSQVALEYLPFKSDGKPVSPNTQKLILDDKNNAKVMTMTPEDMRLTINPQNPSVPVTPAPQQNINQNLAGPVPDYNKYAGPQTTARTRNFYVIAPGGNANMYAAALEYNRYKNAIEWTGTALADWRQPLVVKIDENPSMASGGGKTGLIFNPFTGSGGAETMEIIGNRDSLLMSVIPHETMHIVSAEYFGRPLPRFIDEGISTTTESAIEKSKHVNMLNQFLQQGRWYDINTLSKMKEYPQDIMPLYAQGNSIAEYLLQQGGGGIEGKRKLFEAAGYANKYGWDSALKKYYGANNIQDFQQKWLASLGMKIIAALAKILVIIALLIVIKREKEYKIIKVNLN